MGSAGRRSELASLAHAHSNNARKLEFYGTGGIPPPPREVLNKPLPPESETQLRLCWSGKVLIY